jgi:tetratricopeptide (TPR) repeat protein
VTGEAYDDTAASDGPTGDVDTAEAYAATLSPDPETSVDVSPFDTEASPSPFVVRGVLGRGGMGQVVLAHDRRLGRQIAVKELLSQSDAARARFEREVRLAARLQHPNIVPVYEAGRTPKGEPYYAMRPVAGQTLAKAIDRAKNRAERIALVPRVLAVAEAIAFAHKNGVIHRDLKPTNVLIGEFGETVVIDWGLAKRFDEADDSRGAPASAESADLTRHGSVIGTPAYMAPEQARTEPVDARADVYALGALLYHVLAGVPPYHGARRASELLAQVRAGPPLSLAEVAPDLPADLVAVVERAMARDAKDRYPDARGLADDLGRFTTGRLVSAHAYSIGQLVRRWVRKHRVAVAVSAAAAIVLAAIAVYSVVRIRDERTTALRERAAAMDRQRDVESLLDFMLGDLYDRLEKTGDLQALDGSTEKIADYFARHPVAPGDRVGIRRRANLSVQLAAVAKAKGDLGAAEGRLREALALAEPAAAAAPEDPELEEALYVALEDLADVQLQRGQPAAAMTTIGRASAVARAAAEKGGDVDWRRRVGNVLFLRARGHIATADAASAQHDLDDALAVFRALAAEEPTNRAVQRDVGRVLAKLATMAFEARDHRRAAELAAEVVLVFERLAASEPDQVLARTDLQHALQTLGRYQASAGQRAEARTALERAQALAERLLIDDAGRPQHMQSLAVIMSELASDRRADKDFDGALVFGRRALELVSRLTALDPSNQLWKRNVAQAHDQLAATLREAKDLRGALAEYEAALAIRRELVAAAPDAIEQVLDLAVDLDKSAQVLRDLGDHVSTATRSREAAELREPVMAAQPENRDVHYVAAISYMRTGSGIVDSRGAKADAAAAYERGKAILDGFLARTGRPDPDMEQLSKLLADLRADCCGAPP